MKLLITTQAVDKNDPILGFFHNWLREFSKHFEVIHVICLCEGEYDLPENVHVHSLGKEHGVNYARYLVRLFSYTWKYRGEYDAIFSHMNPHYIVLTGWLWRLMGKRIFFWRNHAKMNTMTRIAAFFAERVFYTSPFACTAGYPHAVQMPVGIDTSLFSPKEREQNVKKKILFLGRISPVKKVEMFVEAGKFLPQEYELHVYGDAPVQDRAYAERLMKSAGSNVLFHHAIKNFETPGVYHAHDVYVNLTPNGSMDKTVLEAVACGTPVIVTNQSFEHVVPRYSFLENFSKEMLAHKITEVATVSEQEREETCAQARQRVLEEHSLEKLGKLLYKYIHG